MAIRNITDEVEELRGEKALSDLAVKATHEIVSHFMSHFQDEGKDKSYRRAMFRQDGDYGCSIAIEVELSDGANQARIKTVFGRI